MICYLMLYFHLYYIIVLFLGQLRSLVKVAWDSPAHRANPHIHQCLLLELIHHFAVEMTNISYLFLLIAGKKRSLLYGTGWDESTELQTFVSL